ncbi:diguanylate cyclase [Labrenzia aggregata]|uniref:Diguanylate cyclase n=1 Tax=Roseibium aggregatum TaxID=187304 RepID=A0A939EC90_9HYPH|nr:diguanylate cyclase [Roseibium aggregatum]
MLIALTSASLAFVGFVSSQASVRQAIAHEEHLFKNTLDHRLRSIVQELVKVATSDQSVARLVRDFDPGYVRQSFNTLWDDYAHSKVMLISGEGQVLAESFGDYTHIVRHELDKASELLAIIEILGELFVRNRVRVPGGYGHRSIKGVDPAQYAYMGFIRIDGKPALVGAMPIMPDDFKETLPDDQPTFILSATYIDDALLRQLSDRVNFPSLRFAEGPTSPEYGPLLSITDTLGSPVGTFRWDWKTAGASIWPTVIPVIAVISAALGAVAFGIAWRIGKLTASLQASEEQNRRLALHDTLSGLANRLQFNRAIESAVHSLPDHPLAVIHCDLDQFKEVNDTFGHSAGDIVIKTMADRLDAIVGGNGLVCRVGGDEFVVIYHGSTARAHLRLLSEALLECARTPVPVGNDRSAQIGLSIGIAVAPLDGATAGALVAASDLALYHSKKSGRSRFTFYSEIGNDGIAPSPVPEFKATARRA